MLIGACDPTPQAYDFLDRGYFPKELPPLFNTSSFADFSKAIDTPEKRFPASCVRFSHSKYASIRRRLDLPNPYQYLQLSDLIAAHWQELRQTWKKSHISKSKPERSEDRAVVGASEFSELPSFRAEARASGRYLFRADISSFYHSIYTHSIPWALHGKDVAKANRVTRPTKKQPTVLWGNEADELARNLQAGQTIGFPIGPDTSFVIAETILCEIDAHLQAKLSDIPSFRFVDDYEFVCRSQPEAEKALAALQDSLAVFELRLNPKKTRITELPDALDTPWVEGLEEFDLDLSPAMSTRLVRYFTRSFELARKHPGEPVLSYATKRLDGLTVEEADAVMLQRLLLQAAMAEPGILRFVFRVFFEHRLAGLEVDHKNLSRALNQMVLRHGPLGHSSEVSWCIWAAAVFGVKLNGHSTKVIQEMADDIVALTAMSVDSLGVFDSVPSRDLWLALAQKSTLSDEHWLLGYEGIGKGWLAAPMKGDQHEKDEFFQSLWDAGVEFVDSSPELEVPSFGPTGPYR